jgi:hypothetical protein
MQVKFIIKCMLLRNFLIYIPGQSVTWRMDDAKQLSYWTAWVTKGYLYFPRISLRMPVKIKVNVEIKI